MQNVCFFIYILISRENKRRKFKLDAETRIRVQKNISEYTGCPVSMTKKTLRHSLA